MDIGLLIPTAGGSGPQTTSTLLSEPGQGQELGQGGDFSVLLKDAAKKMDDAQTPPIVVTDQLIEPVLQTAIDGRSTEAALNGIAGEACSQLCDLQEAADPSADKTEPSSPLTGFTPQGIESLRFIQPGLVEAASQDNEAPGNPPLPVVLPQARTADDSMGSSLQPLVDPAQNNEEPAIAMKQAAIRVQDEPPIRNSRSAPVHVAPVFLDQLSGDQLPSGTLPSGPSPSNQSPIPVGEQQGEKSIHSGADTRGNIQPLDRPLPDRRPSSIVQEEAGQGTTVLGPSLSIRMVGGSGGQDPFGAFAQGDSGGASFHFGGSETQESGVRGAHSAFFSDLSQAARQTQSLPQAIGTSVSTPAAEQLKLAQAFLGESHPANVTMARGMAQTVQVELSSHEAGPMSVRISMQDQTVNTQFTTDRSDLGAILVGRQDLLQQSLTKSGLELGQFQVHVNQEGRQEAFPDRQSRRNGGTSDQPPQLSQDLSEQSHGRERSAHRSAHALSLFA